MMDRLFYQPLNRGGFAIRFILLYVVMAVSRSARMDKSTALVLFTLLTVYLLSITIRRCRDFAASNGKIVIICIIMCIPLLSFFEGIYLCCKKGMSYYQGK